MDDQGKDATTLGFFDNRPTSSDGTQRTLWDTLFTLAPQADDGQALTFSPAATKAESNALIDSMQTRFVARLTTAQVIVSRNHFMSGDPTCSRMEFASLFLFGSRINHSCLPNVDRVAIGDTLYVRASRDIACDEEILHAYSNSYQAPSIRTADLLKGYDFTCQCERCAADSALRKREAQATGLTRSTAEQSTADKLTLQRLAAAGSFLERAITQRDKAVLKYTQMAEVTLESTRALCGALFPAWIALASRCAVAYESLRMPEACMWWLTEVLFAHGIFATALSCPTRLHFCCTLARWSLFLPSSSPTSSSSDALSSSSASSSSSSNVSSVSATSSTVQEEARHQFLPDEAWPAESRAALSDAIPDFSDAIREQSKAIKKHKLRTSVAPFRCAATSRFAKERAAQPLTAQSLLAEAFRIGVRVYGTPLAREIILSRFSS